MSHGTRSKRPKAGKVVSRVDARRRQQLTAIHVGRTQLGIDDETYRAMLRRVSATIGEPCDSSADMTPEQRLAVIAEMRQQGAQIDLQPANRHPGKPRNFDRLPEEAAKIEAQLASMSLTWSYADAIAKRMFRVPFVAWCKQDQLRAIVAALDVEQIKRAQTAEFERLRAALKLRRRDVDALTADLPRGWRRSREVMEHVNERLRARLAAQIIAALDVEQITRAQAAESGGRLDD